VVRDPEVQIGPVYQAVDVFVDHGSRHFQESPGQPSLFNRLLAYLRHWNVVVVVSDMTGVGQGITDALQEAYKRTVFGFDFAKSYGKARLGSDFLAVIETGRFQCAGRGYRREGLNCEEEIEGKKKEPLRWQGLFLWRAILLGCVLSKCNDSGARHFGGRERAGR
jgi:hypothetical protein